MRILLFLFFIIIIIIIISFYHEIRAAPKSKKNPKRNKQKQKRDKQKQKQQGLISLAMLLQQRFSGVRRLSTSRRALGDVLGTAARLLQPFAAGPGPRFSVVNPADGQAIFDAVPNQGVAAVDAAAKVRIHYHQIEKGETKKKTIK
jgi:hypothetical protein